MSLLQILLRPWMWPAAIWWLAGVGVAHFQQWRPRP